MVDTFNSVISFVCTVGGTLALRWLALRYASHDSKASLEATNTELKKAITNLESKETKSQAKIAELQAYIDEHLTKRAIRDRFTVDPATSDLMIGEIHFCVRCFNDGSNPPKEIQMRLFPNGQFICPVCNLPKRIPPAGSREPRAVNI